MGTWKNLGDCLHNFGCGGRGRQGSPRLCIRGAHASASGGCAMMVGGMCVQPQGVECNGCRARPGSSCPSHSASSGRAMHAVWLCGRGPVVPVHRSWQYSHGRDSVFARSTSCRRESGFSIAPATSASSETSLGCSGGTSAMFAVLVVVFVIPPLSCARCRCSASISNSEWFTTVHMHMKGAKRRGGRRAWCAMSGGRSCITLYGGRAGIDTRACTACSRSPRIYIGIANGHTAKKSIV